MTRDPARSGDAPDDVARPAAARTSLRASREHVVQPRNFSPIRSVTRHGRLAFTVFVVMSLLGFFISLKAGGPYYLAEATIHVAPRIMKTLEEDAEVQQQAQDYASFLRQQVHTITRYDVLARAIRSLDGPVIWQHSDETESRAVERLEAALVVEPVKGSYLISVGLAGAEPSGLAEIVNAVTSAYLEVQREEYIWAPSDRIQGLNDYRQQIDEEIAAKTTENGALAAELGLTSFESTQANSYQTSLIEVSTALNEARRELLAAEARLASIENRTARDVADPDSALVELPVRGGAASDRAGTEDLPDAPRHPIRIALDATLAALNQARLDQISAENALVGLVNAQSKMQALELESQAWLQYNQQQATRATTDPLAKQHGELVASLAGLSQDHPGYAVTRAQIETLEREMSSAADAAVARLVADLERRRKTESDTLRAETEVRVSEATRLVKALEKDYDRLVASLVGTVNEHERRVALEDIERNRLYVSRLEEEYERLREKVADYVAKFQKGRSIELDIQRSRSRIRNIEDRIEYFEVESEGFGFARPESFAREPDEPVPSKVLKYFLAFLFLAGFVSIGSAVMGDTVDQRIHGEEEVERSLGILPLVTIREWTSPESRRTELDQIRRLAMHLERERSEAAAHTIVLTSPNRDAGTTTLVRALADELTVLGRSVLTIAANAESPAAGDDGPGLSEALAGTLARRLDPVVSPTHLPLGRVIGGHLASTHRLGEVLAWLGEEFDFVLVDAPPLLASSDAEILVSHADVTLLVVAGERDDLESLRRASAVLERLDPPTVGIVLQRVVDRPGLREIVGSPVEAMRTIFGGARQPAAAPRSREPAPAHEVAQDASDDDRHASRPVATQAPRTTQPAQAMRVSHDPVAPADTTPDEPRGPRSADDAVRGEDPAQTGHDAPTGFETDDVDQSPDAERAPFSADDDVVLLDDESDPPAPHSAPPISEPRLPEATNERPPGVPREAWWRRDPS